MHWFAQSRWTLVCLAALVGSAMFYYWNKRRKIVKAIVTSCDEHLAKLETRGHENAQSIEEKLAKVRESEARLARLRAAQAEAAAAAAMAESDTSSSGVWVSDDDDSSSSERSVGELILAIRDVINGQDAMVVIDAGKDKADRNGLINKDGAHSAERIIAKAR